ncbi:hypothetical protein, partial [Enterococcus sp. LJL90]
MSKKELVRLQNKLAYYEAFHAKTFKTSFIHHEVALYIQEHAKLVSGFDSDGTFIRPNPKTA